MELLSQYILSPFRTYKASKKTKKKIATFPEKSVASYLDYSVDFSRYLQENENIITGNIIVNGTGLTVTSCFCNGSYLTAFISGGTSNNSYYLTFAAQTNLGSSFIQDMILSVVGKGVEVKENYKFLAFTKQVYPPDKKPPLNALKINDRYLLSDSGFFMGI